MNRVPKPPSRAISTIRVTEVAGVTWEGTGAGLAMAGRQLGERHAAATSGQGTEDAGATRWRLTRQGWEVAARLQAEGRGRA